LSLSHRPLWTNQSEELHDRLLLTPRERGMADAEQPLRARGFFALALDGHKRKVDSLTSTSATCCGAGSPIRTRPKAAYTT